MLTTTADDIKVVDVGNVDDDDGGVHLETLRATFKDVDESPRASDVRKPQSAADKRRMGALRRRSSGLSNFDSVTYDMFGSMGSDPIMSQKYMEKKWRCEVSERATTIE